MVDDVDFPMMRIEAIGAVQSLADRNLQERMWINRTFPHEGYFEDLTLNIHILYDDTQVLPDPSTQLGSVLVSQAEVDALQELDGVLSPIIKRLGDRPDADYLADAQWLAVVQRAAEALAVLQGNREVERFYS